MKWAIPWYPTVSYTHLDVYKRQAVENVIKLIDGSRMTKSETVFDVTLREGETT